MPNVVVVTATAIALMGICTWMVITNMKLNETETRLVTITMMLMFFGFLLCKTVIQQVCVL